MEDKTVIQPRFEVKPGTRLNGIYEIEDLIAQGGMGEVYRGFNIETRDPVAIKMIRGSMSGDPNIMALFRREATTLFNLHHEAIVRYFVFTVDPDLKRAYLAMEFVEGPSLATRVSKRPLTSEEARIFVARIGAALDAAHRLGVIHRDISPDNVILPGGEVRNAKLIDFGIARSAQGKEATIIGDGFAGKYNYVSPEQLGLAGGVVTAKSDMYSFGLTLAEALGGRPLDMSGTTLEVVDKRRRVPDISKLPAEFRPLLSALLQPRPEDRPATFAAALANFSGAAPRPAKARRNFAPWIAAALILVSLLGLGAVFRDDIAGYFAKAPVKNGSEAPNTDVAKKTPTDTHTYHSPPLTPSSSLTSTPGPTNTGVATGGAGDQPGPGSTARPASPGSGSSTPPPGDIVSRLEGKDTKAPPDTPTPKNTGKGKGSVTADDLVDALPPDAPPSPFNLPDGFVGKPYDASLPAFQDPGKKGLKLAAQGLPPGLEFSDHGDGSGEVRGQPTSPGSTSFNVTATTHRGQMAQLRVNLIISAPHAVQPPQPSQREITLAEGVAGQDYSAQLPPFRAGTDARGLKLRAEPDPPGGMVFNDDGAGFSRVSGRPVEPGAYSFDVISSDANGDGGRMAVKLTIVPGQAPSQPTETPRPTETSPGTPAPIETRTPTATLPPAGGESDALRRERAFFQSYEGGNCFFAAPLPNPTDPNAVAAFGGDMPSLQNLDTAFQRELGVEPNISAAILSPSQCPIVDLLKLTAKSGAEPPQIALDANEVDANRPLSGRVSGLAGRQLTVVLVYDDGTVVPLPVSAGADGGSFRFDPVRSARSNGKQEAVLAIASQRPLRAIVGPRPTSAAQMVRELKSEWSSAGAAAALVCFSFAGR